MCPQRRSQLLCGTRAGAATNDFYHYIDQHPLGTCRTVHGRGNRHSHADAALAGRDNAHDYTDDSPVQRQLHDGRDSTGQADPDGIVGSDGDIAKHASGILSDWLLRLPGDCGRRVLPDWPGLPDDELPTSGVDHYRIQRRHHCGTGDQPTYGTVIHLRRWVVPLSGERRARSRLLSEWV